MVEMRNGSERRRGEKRGKEREKRKEKRREFNSNARYMHLG